MALLYGNMNSSWFEAPSTFEMFTISFYCNVQPFHWEKEIENDYILTLK